MKITKVGTVTYSQKSIEFDGWEIDNEEEFCGAIEAANFILLWIKDSIQNSNPYVYNCKGFREIRWDDKE